MNRRTWIQRMAVVVAALPFAGFAWAAQEKDASPEWQKEFDDVCSKTQDAMTFTAEELEALIRRCDALEPKIEKLDETRRKIYLKRLRQCRGLYAYVLESKKNEKK